MPIFAPAFSLFERLQIGCGTKYFTMTETIANHIDQQIKDGLIDELSGLTFDWWAIWTRRASNRLVNFISFPKTIKLKRKKNDENF